MGKKSGRHIVMFMTPIRVKMQVGILLFMTLIRVKSQVGILIYMETRKDKRKVPEGICIKVYATYVLMFAEVISGKKCTERYAYYNNNNK